MVKVWSSQNIADITYIQYLLDEAGIRFYLAEVETAGVLPHLAGAIGAVKIMVDETDYEVARRIIEENLHNNKNRVSVPVHTYSSDLVCPVCSSDNIRDARKKRPLVSIILSLLFFFPYPFRRRYYHCLECSAEWNKKDVSPAKLLIAFIFIIFILYIWLRFFR